MKRHNIKIQEVYADAVLSGEKTFEIRENDRGYQKGDEVCFSVVDKSGITVQAHKLNGMVFTITYLLHGWGLKDNWCVFSIRPVESSGGKDINAPTTKQDSPVDALMDDFANQQRQQQPVQLKVDPSTQCIDCDYKVLVSTPDGYGTTIRCGMYMTDDGKEIYRKPTDTCVADIVDTSMMTTKRERENG